MNFSLTKCYEDKAGRRMGRSKRGRPLEKKPKGKLLTVDEAIELARITLQREHPPFARQTIYNKMCQKVLTRYGTYHTTLVDSDEVIKKLCA